MDVVEEDRVIDHRLAEHVSAYDPSEPALDAQRNMGPLTEAQIPDGFPFGPDSAIRHLTDPTLIYYYVAIAGLTVANDKIAMAVHQHSGVLQDPIGRLLRTANSAVELAFGNEQEALAKAREIWNFHNGTVHGEHENVNYEANDGRLQAWVLACVFKGSEEAARRWGKPFTDEDRVALYEDIKIFGRVFGIPPGPVPETVEELEQFWNDALNDEGQGEGFLLQTDTSKEMMRMAFQLEGFRMRGFARNIGRAVLSTSLDPRLQERAGIYPTEQDQRISERFDTFMRIAYKWIPRWAREQAIPMYMRIRRTRLGPKIGRAAIGLANHLLLTNEVAPNLESANAAA